MADLDDFFAKKDRKKSKSKKFATTEEVAKKLESDNVSKKPEKPTKKEKSLEGDEQNAEKVEADEWKEFEEEKKDYTGLKIGNLTLNVEAVGNGSGGEMHEQMQPTYDEAGNEMERKTGPWNRMEGGSEQPKAAEEKQPEAVVVATPNVVGGAYVPPSKRNQSAQPVLQSMRLRSRAAPDIHNEDNFPTLSANKDGKRNRSEGAFEVVAPSKANSLKHAQQSTNSGQAQKLSLGNRFNSLSHDS